MKTTTQHLANHAAWLADIWPALHESRLKGTPRRWRQHDANPEQPPEKPGAGTAAPLHLDVLDLLSSIEATAKRIATLIQATGINANPEKDTPQSNLRYISSYAQVLPEGSSTADCEIQLRTYRNNINSQWAEVIIGQRIKAPCPWCNQEKLKIRTIGPAHAPEPVVRCESMACEPPSADCGTWFRGPCWPMHEWQWLAGRIDHALEAHD